MLAKKKAFIEALKNEEKKLPELFTFLFENFQQQELTELATHYSTQIESLEKLYQYFRHDIDSVKELNGESLANFERFITELKLMLEGKRIALSIVQEIEKLTPIKTT